MNDNILNTVFEYRRHGLATIPLSPGEKRPPKGFQWKAYQKRLPTEGELTDWFDRTDFGIAVVLGHHGLTVRDFDLELSYTGWANQHPDLARDLPTVRTKRGAHVYFRGNFDGIKRLGDGELRGSGSFVACPPSRHPSGGRYRWIVPLTGCIPILSPALLEGQPPFTPIPHDTTHGMCVTVDDAIKATLPTGYGQRDNSLFLLARFLKGIRPDASTAELVEIVRRWHTLALPKIKTKPFPESKASFLRSWARVLHPAGKPLWRNAVALAGALTNPSIREHYGEGHHARLATLCLALHQSSGGSPFPLGCRKAADYLGVGFKTAARALQVLVRDQVIEITSKKILSGKFAFEYRWIGDSAERLKPPKPARALDGQP